MNWIYLLLTLALFSLIFSGSAQDIPPSEFGIKEVLKIDIQINTAGLITVKENLVLNQTTGRILIPKSSVDLSLLDSKGNHLGYEVNQYSKCQSLNIYLKLPQDKSVTLSYTASGLTKKNASKRTFKFSSLSTPRVTIVKIEFPSGANITSLRSSEVLYIYPPRFASPLFLYPQSNTLSLECDYELPADELSTTNFIPLFLLSFILLFILLSLLYIKKRSQPKEKLTPKEGSKINSSVLKMLDKTEKEIIKMIENSPEEEITQAYIYKTLEIPKSSLSEIIRRLEQRDLIEKKKEGRTNWIKLKKWIFE